jgi:multiple sugar transport system substrate-binding protein
MRRMAPSAAVVASAVLLLAGCGSSGDSTMGGRGGNLTVYIASQPNYPSQFAQWQTEVAQKFKAATGASLTIETYSSAADETTKIQASIVAGNGPDVYQLGTTFTPVAYGPKGFVKLTDGDWQKAGGNDQFVAESFGMSGPDASSQIGIPVAMRPFGMAYNTELFKVAGISTPPTTWDELIADAQKLTNGSTYGLAIGYADGFDPWKLYETSSLRAPSPGRCRCTAS